MNPLNILTPETSLSLDLQGIKLIEASAGTGKTYTISNLFCRFVIEGKEIQNILLVTFTNAATDELKQRIRQRLKIVLKLFKSDFSQSIDDQFLAHLSADFQTKSESDQFLIINRLTFAMRSFDEAAILTINGFCQRMLSDYAFNSAQHFELNLIQNDHDLWQTAIKDWWRNQSYVLTELHFVLFSKSVGSLSKVLKNSLALRSESSLRLVPNEHQSMTALYAEWDVLSHDIDSFKKQWMSSKALVFDFFNEHKLFKKRCLHAEDKIDANLLILNDFLSSPSAFLIHEFECLCHSVITKNTLKAHLNQHDYLEDALFHQADDLMFRQAALIEQFSASALINAEQFASEQTKLAKQKQQSITFNDQLKYLDIALASSNGALAEHIKTQFPIALIDEFQDTNELQYSIFKQIYHHQDDISLIMIGDPKQAIYSFRGGDIFTYMSAKRHVGDQLFSLNSNWRSTQPLINATNQFFIQRGDAFIYSDAMPFEPVIAGSDQTPVLMRSGVEQSALSLWHLAQGHSTQSAAFNINQHVANEICELINEGQNGNALLGDQAVKAADIAILVRSNYEGKELASTLKQRGIHCINIGKDKVLQSDAAKGLLSLLEGVAQADNLAVVRAMLASRLLMWTPLQINAFMNTESLWIDWLYKVKVLHELWLKEGFISMFNSLLRQLNIAESLITFDDSERQITNLLHCVDIIQQAAKTLATPQAICLWLKQQINHPQLNNNNNDEDELRLESDVELVKIVTVHKSKGLEYPLVFVPFLWKSKPISKSQAFYQYHNERDEKVFDFIFGDNANATQAFIQADKERTAEDMRLLYVALTRAKSKCYLVTGQVSRSGSPYSALSYLCHPAQTALDLNLKRADITAYSKKHEVAQELQQLAQNSDNTIDFKVLSEAPLRVNAHVIPNKNRPIKAAQFSGQLNFDWQISSFSRMTRDVHQVAHGGQVQTTNDDIFNFKRGGDAGTFLHHILELLDFSEPIEHQSQILFKRFAPRYHLESEHNEAVVAKWMTEIVNTSLNDQGFSLAQLKPQHRLDELEFDFSLNAVDVAQLNDFLSQRTGQTGSPLSISNFKGMMTGFIDLVFEHEGKYYIADYKSNFLGSQLSDYTPDKLQQAVIDRRYDLQYLLYSLALHRYLRYRLPNYDYQKHFGGVYYLFLRAMRQKTGQQFGVFYDLPSFDEMCVLDKHLFKTLENC